MRTKRFTILHSNDMHGDFLAEVQGAEGNLIGGLALLSGYVNRVRKEEITVKPVRATGNIPFERSRTLERKEVFRL